MNFAVYSKKERSCHKGLPRNFFLPPVEVFFCTIRGKKIFWQEATNESKRQGESEAEPPSGSEGKEAHTAAQKRRRCVANKQLYKMLCFVCLWANETMGFEK